MEEYYDRLLNINTTGYKYEVNNSIHYHPYEPTPYSALVELFKYFSISENDCVVDFGCGKGRLNFFVNYHFKAFATGIEMNEQFFNEAIQNRQAYLSKHRPVKNSIHFTCTLAQQYEIQPDDNIFYFFNPFSVQVFMKVVQNILRSIEENNRLVNIILYYPTDDYIHFLTNQTSFEFVQEIYLSKKDANDRFLIFSLQY